MIEKQGNKPCVPHHGGVVERSSALSVLLVHISCILKQKLTGDERTLKLNVGVTRLQVVV